MWAFIVYLKSFKGSAFPKRLPGPSLAFNGDLPKQTQAIVDSGCEIALHGYSHEGASQLTADQERDVLEKCIDLATNLTGKKPRGYRAPLYQLKSRTVSLLQEYGFLWDSSLSHYDSQPYFLPKNPPPVEQIDFSPDKKASNWMHPSPNFDKLEKSSLVELPCNWYHEDMTPLQYFPNTPNSSGYVDVRLIEQMWKDRFHWLRGEIEDCREEMTVFSLVIHPDTSGMAHVVGMLERFLGWLKLFGENVEFQTYEQIATEWVEAQQGA